MGKEKKYGKFGSESSPAKEGRKANLRDPVPAFRFTVQILAYGPQEYTISSINFLRNKNKIINIYIFWSEGR